MRVRIRRAFFDSPITDEIALSRKARSYIRDLQKPLSREQVLTIAKDESVELATRCFYEAILQSEHKSAIENIAGQSTEPVAVDRKIKLYLVPGMFYRGHPEIGTDGSLVAEVARQFDFDIHFVKVESTGSIATNVEILQADLEAETSTNVWLISISKGACEVRKYLQENSKPDCLKGWVSISGVHKGVPFVDRKFSSSIHRLFFASLCRITGVDYEVLKEMRTNRSFWQNKQWPDDLEVVNIVPVPIRSHVNKTIIRRYQQTLTHGPNDGFIPLVDALDLPGHIFPIWGCDHFMRTPDLSSYLYKVLNYIATTREGHDETIHC